jgi:hypothetical protein
VVFLIYHYSDEEFVRDWFENLGLSKEQVDTQVSLYKKFKEEREKGKDSFLEDFIKDAMNLIDGKELKIAVSSNENELYEKRMKKITYLVQTKAPIKINSLVSFLDFNSKDEFILWWFRQKSLSKYPIKDEYVYFREEFIADEILEEKQVNMQAMTDYIDYAKSIIFVKRNP